MFGICRFGVGERPLLARLGSMCGWRCLSQCNLYLASNETSGRCKMFRARSSSAAFTARMRCFSLSWSIEKGGFGGGGLVGIIPFMTLSYENCFTHVVR
jgi:hypothetical protein